MFHMPFAAGHTARLFHGSDLFELGGFGPLARTLETVGLEPADLAGLSEAEALDFLEAMGADRTTLADPILQRDLASLTDRR